MTAYLHCIENVAYECRACGTLRAEFPWSWTDTHTETLDNMEATLDRLSCHTCHQSAGVQQVQTFAYIESGACHA